MTWLQHLQHISINWRHNSLRSHFNNPKCLGFSASFRKSAEHGGHFPPSIHPELNWILENFWTLPLNKDVRQNPQFDSKNHILKEKGHKNSPFQMRYHRSGRRNFGLRNCLVVAKKIRRYPSVQLNEPFEGRPPQWAQKEVREAMLSCKKHPFFTCRTHVNFPTDWRIAPLVVAKVFNQSNKSTKPTAAWMRLIRQWAPGPLPKKYISTQLANQATRKHD